MKILYIKIKSTGQLLLHKRIPNNQLLKNVVPEVVTVPVNSNQTPKDIVTPDLRHDLFKIFYLNLYNQYKYWSI